MTTESPERFVSASSARQVAAAVLVRVWRDDAYAAAALSAALDEARLEPRDRGLCTELSYGVLRVAPFLERQLTRLGKLKASDQLLRAHLFVAAYQIFFLDRVPAHAAVDEAVRSVSAARGKRVGGFANALLRNLCRERPSVTLSQATLESAPSWLRKRLVRDVGQEAMMALLLPAEVPRPALCWFQSEPIPAWFDEQCAVVDGVPGAFTYRGGGDPRRHAPFQDGAFSVQEVGSQCVAWATGVERQESVLDVCAGRGQKALLLARAGGARVTATDLHDHKLRALAQEAERLGVDIATRVHDWTQPAPSEWTAAFDRVLVDAPCSGVGTLRRRPEILRRLGNDDPARMAELQRTILRHAAACVAPGGVLTFSTCSVLDEESALVADDVARALALQAFAPPTRVDAFIARGARRAEGAQEPEPSPDPAHSPLEVPASFRLLPSLHGTDGYFVARFRAPGA